MLLPIQVKSKIFNYLSQNVLYEPFVNIHRTLDCYDSHLNICRYKVLFMPSENFEILIFKPIFQKKCPKNGCSGVFRGPKASILMHRCSKLSKWFHASNLPILGNTNPNTNSTN